MQGKRGGTIEFYFKYDYSLPMKLFKPKTDYSDFYLQKKSEYTYIFLWMILSVMVLILMTEMITEGFSSVKLLITSGFILYFSLLFLLVRKGYLERAVNLLIFAGTARCLQIFFYQYAIQYYLTSILIIFSIAVVHVKKYQRAIVYIIVAGSWILKIIAVYNNSASDSMFEESLINQTLYSTWILLVTIIVVEFIVVLVDREIYEAKELKELADTDSLTGIRNRRSFRRSLENKVDYCLLLLDIDYFKKINDNFGHAKGDEVLQTITTIIQEIIRDKDLLFRWGGEEFLIILPDVDLQLSLQIAERIRQGIELRDFGEGIRVSASIGSAKYIPDESIEDLTKRADDALYLAKKNGRNRIESEESL